MADRLISADALEMMRFVVAQHKEPEVKSYMMGWNDAIDAIIDNAPTIEAEPRKRGRWIIHDSGWEECSECHWVNTTHIVYHYCPNCGAKMNEVEE